MEDHDEQLVREALDRFHAEVSSYYVARQIRGISESTARRLLKWHRKEGAHFPSIQDDTRAAFKRFMEGTPQALTTDADKARAWDQLAEAVGLLLSTCRQVPTGDGGPDREPGEGAEQVTVTPDT